MGGGFVTRPPLPRAEPDDRASAIARLVVHHETRGRELRERAYDELNEFRALGLIEMAEAFDASASRHRRTLRAVVRSECVWLE